MTNRFLLSALGLCAAAGTVFAQPTIITQWNFNSQPTGQLNNSPTPFVGFGTARPLGMTNGYTYSTTPPVTGSVVACDVLAAGASSDVANSPNNCWRVRGSDNGTLATAGIGWALQAPQFTQGAQFDISTVNYADVVLTFDWFCTNQGVRNMQVQYSLDGGSSWNNIGGILIAAVNGWVNNLTYDFSGITGADDNPNFRVRLVSVYDPTYSGPGAPTFGSASGGIYNNRSGNWRFDAITLRGTAIRSVGPLANATASAGAVCNTGGNVTFTVQTQGGANPPSSGISVRADLSTIGLSSTQSFFDNGTNGDLVAGDGTFTYAATVPSGLTVGSRTITTTVTDAQSRSGTSQVSLGIADCSVNSASRIVISQIFGSGGALGETPSQDAPYNSDFIEIYNRSNQSVNLNGWSVQYSSQASAGGFDSAGDKVDLSGTINPGQYMLIRMSDPVPGFFPLPTPDFSTQTGFGGMGNTGGRVALSRTSTLLGTNYTSTDIEDFVGYGGALNFEGAAATGTPGSSTGVLRKLNASQDTNQNFHDFEVLAPTPRNRSFGGFLTGTPSTSLSAVCAGSEVVLRLAITPGNGSSGIRAFADVSAIEGTTSSVELFDNGLNGDTTQNDGIYSASYLVSNSASQGLVTIGFRATDLQGSVDTSQSSISIGTCVSSSAPVVISQIYGGGGNNDSGFNADFIELFNRSQDPVNLTGWTVQYARVTDTLGVTDRIVPLSGIIGPGEYRLVVTNVPLQSGTPVPTADFAPAPVFGLDNVTARVALVSSSLLLGNDWTRADVVDQVGYGILAQNFEGVGAAPSISNLFVAVRKEGGCQDFNQNSIDFDAVLALSLPRNSASAANICPFVPPTCDCAADYNADGGVTGDDVAAFFTDFENSAGCSDTNQDGGVDGADVESFFILWEMGGC